MGFETSEAEFLVGVTLPNNLQAFTFGDYFSQSSEGATFPYSLRNWTFGFDLIIILHRSSCCRCR